MADFPRQTITTNEILLRKTEVAAQGMLGPQLLHDLRLESCMEREFDRLVFRLRTHVYAHEVDRQEVRVPFEAREPWSAPAPRLQWALWAVVLGGMVLTALTLQWAVFALSVLAALAAVAVTAANPPRSGEAVARGVAVVHREQLNSFPDNAMVYPDDLGAAVRKVMLWTDVEYEKKDE